MKYYFLVIYQRAGELQRKNISNFFNSSRKIITNGTKRKSKESIIEVIRNRGSNSKDKT